MANLTIREILKKSPEERKELYQVSGQATKNIDKVTIDGNVFTDYSAFSFIMEKSYVKSPVRSGDGSIPNLDSYSWFLTPHLKIDFSLMSIDSYRTIMTLIRSRSEHIVTCYDVVADKDVTHKMYFATEQMPKLWTIAKALNGGAPWVELLGVYDYTVELIGTNTSFDTINVVYVDNLPSGSMSAEGTDDLPIGAEIIVGKDTTFQNKVPSGYKFKYWNDKRDGTGVVYIDGYSLTLYNSLTLYAIWETTN